MCHAPDTCSSDDKIAAVSSPCAAGRGNPVRGFPCNRRRGGGYRIRCDAAWSWRWCGSLDSGQAGAARDRAPFSGRTWPAQTFDGDAAFSTGGCDDGGRGRIALQGAGGCGCRNSWRSCSGEFHRDEAACIASRSIRCALLADPACGECRPECCTRPLADFHAALGRQPRRSARARRSALAGRTVPVARRAAGRVGRTS